MRVLCRLLIALKGVVAVTFTMVFAPIGASAMDWDVSDYHYQPGLEANVEDGVLTVEWEGKDETALRARFASRNGVPTILELSIRGQGGAWSVIGSDLQPEFRIVSGLRRVTQQQTEPLEELGVPLTAETLDRIKWDAFWDAPLFIEEEGKEMPTRTSSIPAKEPFANHPGMPRKPEEVIRSTATYRVSSCSVRTNGNRLEVEFPGVEAGVFSGKLRYDFFKGTNLIRQMLVAKTEQPSVAFKYDAGLRGLAIEKETRLDWRDLEENWQSLPIASEVSGERPMVVYSSNRVMAATLAGGGLATFPPPHSFYWARETEQNLGYSWYRKDGEERFSMGMRQAELEIEPLFFQNFALYNARPGKWQRLPLFIVLSPEDGREAIASALAFTRGDRFKALPGFKVMGRHYHVGLVDRLKKQGGLDQSINDVATIKAAGIDIFEVVDGVRGPARHDRGEAYLDALAEYYEAARLQSSDDFLVVPNDENSTGGRPPFLGGHYDLIWSKPVYWRPGRDEGEPLFEPHAKYGIAYNLGTPADLMRMTERENAIVSLPHPRAKRSTGYPEAIWNEEHFQHENYIGLGYRWGMGIDASETRLGEYRFLRLWDETNNRMVQEGAPLKCAQAISEARSDKGTRGKPRQDDVYGMSPVNYLKIDRVPTVDDMSSIVNALKGGDYFVTSGEVLLPHFEIREQDGKWVAIAELEWTFPLEFVELVFGDGENVSSIEVSTTELPAFGAKRFEIPFDAQGKSWVRFAAWDIATNGAMAMPVDLRGRSE